ncbi:L-2-amino-thiazoline-4-carboxylic acid hydrolase [Sphaerimonospora mesophila]|uniref:L-2-amino-thiazoline-4-carboxylic acid hydrolase n=1 Tax=Sphaerimonospora mesophila TaxID=37483 RepID=UPI0006E3AE0F
MINEPGDLMTSLVTTMTHEARIVRHAGLAYTRARREAGLAVVERALRGYFDWRAAAAAGRGGAGLPDIVRSWRTAELLSVNAQGWGELRVGTRGLRLRLDGTPELLHLGAHGVPAFAVIYYRALVSALMRAAGLPGDVRAEWRETTLTLEAGEAPEPADEVRPAVALSGEEGLALLRATSENRGALLVFLGRTAEQTFGADGEQMYREAVRGFGAERGEAMRLDHLSKGLTLDLRNMMELYDSGGNEDVWQYRDEGVLTPAQWSQDCTFCPFVRPWNDLDGLRYGEIYDHEFHVAQFKAYREDIEVKWGELQSRGDATCEFRFSITGALPV